MYGYEADFAHEGQIVMKLRRDPALRSNDMDIHSLKMIQRNRIPHILHADMQELDYDVTLVYEISGKRMLQQLIRSEQLTELQYYEWMLQLLRLLSSCREYMLNPNHLLLHEQFMFVEGGTQQGVLYVPYIPTHEALHAKAAIEGLRRLAVQLSSIVQQWTNDGFQQLLRKLHDDSQSIEQIQQFVQAMLVQAPPVQQHGIAGMYDNEIAASSFSEGGQLSRSEREYSQHAIPDRRHQFGTKTEQQRLLDKELFSQAGSAASHVSHSAPNRSREVDWGFDDEEEEEEAVTQSPLIGAGIALLLGALGWKFGYMTTANTVSMLLSLVVTLIGVLLGFAWWRGWFHSMFNRSKGSAAVHKRSKHSKNDPLLPDFASIELTSQLKREAAEKNGFSYPSNVNKDSKAAVGMSRDAVQTKQELGGRNGLGVLHTNPSSYSASNDYQNRSVPGASSSPYRAREETVSNAWGDARQESRPANAVEQHYSHLAAHTSVLNSGPQDATVLLTSNQTGNHQAKAGKLRIQRLAKDGVTVAEEKTAGEWPFVLGRAEQGVHYLLMETGVSKLHCELMKDTEGYTIQDLGSKNGTELNGELLIPYKTYQVEDGARIKLGHTILVLHHI
ncbi:DUF6382 domain-containing protein [Paenibacillus sp. 1001270B_150601_E10]|uniref:DUF6382 domain-containing protein n=1 Tax=Paenibacillus sp. 1001270B_150601_E10 TaxID=2787079 RepID=UPI00189FC1C9|nr:DUF6382 domain-containing protein [Paenibacillus sp. 1001270B_150601_E10]